MASLTIAIAMIGFAIAKGCRYFVKCQRQSLLDPPIDLLNDNQGEAGTDSDKNGDKEKHHKYSKAQARQRFKKGKS